MTEYENQTISFVAHEADMARMERSNKRWFIFAIIELIIIIGMVVGIAIYESQFEVVEESTTQTVTQDVDNGDGDALVKGIIGDVNGTSETDGKNDSKKKVSEEKETLNDKSRQCDEFGNLALD